MRDLGSEERPRRVGLAWADPVEAEVRTALGPGLEICHDPAANCALWLFPPGIRTEPGPDALSERLTRDPETPCIALVDPATRANVVRAWFRAGARDVIPTDLVGQALRPAILAALGHPLGPKRESELGRDRAVDSRAQTRGLELALHSTREAYDQTLAALVAALDCREKETACHSQRVATYSIRIGMGLELDETDLEHLYRGALIHDIGKIGTPDAILLKPGSLTQAEWAVMQEHTELGTSLVANIAFLDRARVVLAAHHEAWDGSGYPLGLSGYEIPLAARIFAVADTYDALRSERPYKPAVSHEQALETLRLAAGARLDPAIAAWFLRQPGETWAYLAESARTTWTFRDAYRACVAHRLR